MTTTELIVRNYRRIKTADILIGPGVTLVCGRNMQGKTSLAEAARAAATMDPLPALGDAEEKKRTKSRAKELVHAGADAGSSTLKRDDGAYSQVLWPKCDTKMGGRGGPKASPLAAGIRDASLVAMDKVERFVTLREALGAVPTFNDMWAWLNMAQDGVKPPHVPEDFARMIWKAIEDSDWRTAQERAKTNGHKLTAAYEELTGGRWGSVKAESWRPEGWDTKWDNQPINVFVGAAKQAEAAYHASIGTAAIDKVRRQQLETMAAGLTQAQADLDQLLNTIEVTKTELEAHEKKCSSFKNPDALATAKCPCCGEEVAIVMGSGHGGADNAPSLQKPVKLDEKAVKKARMEKASLDGHGQNIRDRLNTMIYRDKPNAEKAVKDAQEAADAIAAMGADTSDAAAVEKAKAEMDAALRTLGMVEAVDKAAGLHQRILQNIHIQAALGDAGVRAYVLRSKIKELNEMLAKFSAVAELGDVVVNEEDASITCNGRPYRDLSGAEGLRLRTLLQVAMAKYDGSDLVVVDIKDFTDRKHILGMVKMLNAADMDALVVCHMNLPNDAPDLSSPQAVERGYVGRSYWLDDGVVAPLSEVMAQAAA